MEKIEDLHALLVSFSKLLSWLVKKASEVSTMCLQLWCPRLQGEFSRLASQEWMQSLTGFLEAVLGQAQQWTQTHILMVSFTVELLFMIWTGPAWKSRISATQKKRNELLEKLRTISHGPWGALVCGPEKLQSLWLEDPKLLVKEPEDLKRKGNARANEVLGWAARPDGLPLSANPIQMFNPHGNEAMNTARTWFMGEHVPSSE